MKRKYSFIKTGQKENRFDKPRERIKNVLKIAFGQSKLLRDPIAGTIHFLIFWGFILFLFAVLEAIIQGFYSPFTIEFLGPFYSAITLTQDIFGILVLIAIDFALIRRYILNVERLPKGKHEKFDATLILTLIAVVVLSMFLQNSASIAANNFNLHDYEVRPISAWLSSILFSGGANTVAVYEIAWWIHILTIFVFMNYLPYSKHFHVYTSIPNVYFSKIGTKKYALKPINLEDEEAEQFGAADIQDLSWKQLLDGYACTECGRCTDACPAAATG
ncbi:MAG: respiratory nitrate reductase subunit gamma, partial [Melioribacteraceae bacterium]|nr:respiratory nitrate reductase subunit gamma [Melioribacteraceae bacterium]